MCIWWWQTTWVVLVPLTTHIPSLSKIGHYILMREVKVYLLMLTSNLHLYIHPYICTYIQTAWQMKTKWSFQHSRRSTKITFCLISQKQQFVPYILLSWGSSMDGTQNERNCNDLCIVQYIRQLQTKWRRGLSVHWAKNWGKNKQGKKVIICIEKGGIWKEKPHKGT